MEAKNMLFNGSRGKGGRSLKPKIDNDLEATERMRGIKPQCVYV
jgi:hypothetical protein